MGATTDRRPVPERGGLVLTVRPGEGVWVGDTWVGLVWKERGQTQFRIVAPPEVRITRVTGKAKGGENGCDTPEEPGQ
jgi:hypothetical protein